MIEPTRLKDLNDRPERAGDYVLYWMQQSQREAFNPALETAIAHANRLGLPVVTVFAMTEGFPEANARHYAFLIEGLRDAQAAISERGIGFLVLKGDPDAVALRLAQKAAMVVCDCGYLRVQRQWRAAVAEGAACRVLQVEGDVVVPVETVSTKRESAARTIRPKIMRLRDDYLEGMRRTPVKHRGDHLGLPKSLDLGAGLLATLDVDQSVRPVKRFTGGWTTARAALDRFLEGPLDGYADGRAEPGRDAVSFLSAHLHFGHISPVEIALAARGGDAPSADRAAYLEELVVRRELAMNFVENTPDYDRYDCLPDWAKATLAHHRADRRAHVYDREELAAGETHDRFFNAAMKEMRETGYMHNRMRMYWGKKILEWSRDAETAHANALTLNNRYFLCGRDANSFANIAWCFGLHDRPWPERAIFGKVRSMTAGGLERKVDMDLYLARVEALAAAENA